MPTMKSACPRVDSFRRGECPNSFPFLKLNRTIGRRRPCALEPHCWATLLPPDAFSFPSGHTSAAFAWATVANAHYGPKVGIPSYLVASAIGASRLVKDKHYLSDVLAGATLGYIVGRTVVRENGEPLARRTRVSLVPTTDAKGTGAGVGLSVEW